MRRTALILATVLAVTLWSPGPASAAGSSCTVYAGRPRVINETVLYGSGTQVCSGDYGRQCVRVHIQQKENHLWPIPDEWHTKRTSIWDCTYDYFSDMSTAVVCDNRKTTTWRVKAVGTMLWGQLRGIDYSYNRDLPCRVYPVAN